MHHFSLALVCLAIFHAKLVVILIHANRAYMGISSILKIKGINVYKVLIAQIAIFFQFHKIIANLTAIKDNILNWLITLVLRAALLGL